MIAKENSHHDESGHQVAADDGPRGQRVEEPGPQGHDHGQREDLEAAEEHEDPEEDARRFRRTDNGVCLITQPMIDKLEQ